MISPTPLGALNWSSGSFFIETSIDLTELVQTTK